MRRAGDACEGAAKERAATAGQPPPALGPAAPQGGQGDGASLFTAIQEQLGLRLVATRGPVEVLVLDSAERPTED